MWEYHSLSYIKGLNHAVSETKSGINTQNMNDPSGKFTIISVGTCEAFGAMFLKMGRNLTWSLPFKIHKNEIERSDFTSINSRYFSSHKMFNSILRIGKLRLSEFWAKEHSHWKTLSYRNVTDTSMLIMLFFSYATSLKGVLDSILYRLHLFVIVMILHLCARTNLQHFTFFSGSVDSYMAQKKDSPSNCDWAQADLKDGTISNAVLMSLHHELDGWLGVQVEAGVFNPGPQPWFSQLLHSP